MSNPITDEVLDRLCGEAYNAECSILALDDGEDRTPLLHGMWMLIGMAASPQDRGWTDAALLARRGADLVAAWERRQAEGQP